jgi:hypothetical protein
MGNKSMGRGALSALRPLRRSALTWGLLILPGICHAANSCPWINETTASGVLGGDAIGSFSEASSSQPAVCTFVQTVAGGTRTLRIAVEQTPDFLARLESEYKVCGTDPAPLPAIGNEARICNADDGKKVFAERVVGRVRDQVFTITIGSTLKRDSILTREALRTRVSTAAEQVSGNLF